MRSIAGLVIALVLAAAGPAAAQSDLSALRGKARMNVTVAMAGVSLAEGLSLLADAADIEIRLEADAPAAPNVTAAFINASFTDALSVLMERDKLKATAIDHRVVVVAPMAGQETRPSVAAPPAATSAIRLRFEIYKNQQPVARPLMGLAMGKTGSVFVRNVANITVTAAATDGEHVSLAFEIKSGATTLKPQLVLRAEEPGSISWISGSDNFELRVTRMQ